MEEDVACKFQQKGICRYALTITIKTEIAKTNLARNLQGSNFRKATGCHYQALKNFTTMSKNKAAYEEALTTSKLAKKKNSFKRLLSLILYKIVNPIQDRPFRGCSRMRGPKICPTYPAMIKLGTIIP